MWTIIRFPIFFRFIFLCFYSSPPHPHSQSLTYINHGYVKTGMSKTCYLSCFFFAPESSKYSFRLSFHAPLLPATQGGCIPQQIVVLQRKNSKKHFGILRDKRHDTREVCRCRRVPSGVCVGTAAEHKLTCLPDSQLALFTSVFADFRGLRNLAYFVTNIYQVRLVQRKAYCFQTGRRAQSCFALKQKHVYDNPISELG